MSTMEGMNLPVASGFKEDFKTPLRSLSWAGVS
jgi:hypothetical protein